MKQLAQGKDRIMYDYVAYGVPAGNEFSGYYRNRLALLCCLSLLFHAIFIYAAARFAPMNFDRPVVAGQVIYVGLNGLKTSAAQPALTPKIGQNAPPPVTKTSADSKAVPVVTDPFPDSRHVVEQKKQALPTPDSNIIGTKVSDKNVDPVGADKNQAIVRPANGIRPARLMSLPPPIRHATEFLSHKHERLTYQISMYGIPIGDARIEATNNNDELRISSRVKFNASISLVYPVDITTETRMFNGRYIMTTIKRHDGNKQTDVGFTLCLGEKNVLWVDRLNKRYNNTSVSTDQVMDTITGLYFLRNQHLEVGKSMTLDLFDNDTYVQAPVQVLRKELVRLSNLREVEAFVVQPQLTTRGGFDRVCDLLIWFTADENGVPVKLETAMPFGKITAELISVESE